MSNRSWDERSYRDDSGRYVTKTTYKIPRDDDRMSAFREDRSSARGVETRIVRRSETPPRYGKPRDDYQLDRYIRTTEYYPPRAPVVVPREEEDFQLVRRSDYEDQQVARGGRDEDYYYERRIVERDDRTSRSGSRERRKRRSRSRHYSSDDDMVYVKREVTEGRGGDEHRKRHLLEGAAAGVGVAELLRHNRVRKGEDPGTTKGRIGRDVGAAAAGALGAEVISRARSAYRSRSRAAKSRAGSEEDRDGRRRRRRDEERSRSRSESTSRVKTLAGIGLGVAALAAAAGYAKHKHDQNKLPEEERGRSKSRRRASTGTSEVDTNKNRNMALAGVGGAAVAGLIERARSKSRAREGRSRSHNRLKTGLPIVAAGLGSAAIAGIVENRKEKKAEEERQAALDEAARIAKQRGRSVSRSRSRHRSNSMYDGPPMASSSTPGLIEYGNAPINSYPNNPQDYYRTQQSQYDYALPAAGGAAAGYGASRAAETYSPREYSPDRRRRDPSADSSDDGTRRRRHRRRKSNAERGSRERSQSRVRELATAGLAAGAAALGMNEYNKRREKKKAADSEARERAEAEQNAAYDPNSPAYSQFSPLSPSHQVEQGYAPENYYPHTNQFAPPPGGYQPSPRDAAYNPAEYAPAHANANANEYYQPHQGYSPAQDPYSPPPPPVGANYAPAGAASRGEENVSPGYVPAAQYGDDGLRGRDETPRPNRHRRAKSVQFAGDRDRESPDGALSPDDRRRRRRRHRDYDSSEATSDSDTRESNRRRPRRRDNEQPSAPRAPSPAHSDSTIDLPDRFDNEGRPKQPQNNKDPIADKIEQLLNGQGSVGKIFKNIKDEFLGGSSGNRDRR